MRTIKSGILFKVIFVLATIFFAKTIYSQGTSIELENISTNSKTPIKLYVLESTTMQISDMSFFDISKKGQKGKLVNTVYLIKHPKGTILFDTGDADSIADIEGGLISPVGVSTLNKKLFAQLKEINLEPKDIDYLAMSHLHTDHVGNVAYFQNSTLLIQRDEFKAIDQTIEMMKSYGLKNTESYELLKVFRSKKLIDGHYDLFGDGSVVFISTPGHSSGHQALFINLPEYGPIILGADLFHTQYMRENYIIPSFITDKRQMIKSFSIVDDIIEQTGAELWLTHDINQYKKQRHSPLFYE